MSFPKNIEFGFDLTLRKGAIPTPHKLQFWNDKSMVKRTSHSAPLKFMADALVGLSFLRLNTYFKSPLFNPKSSFQFQEEAWMSLDPHHEIYQRSQSRVAPLKLQSPKVSKQECENFEKKFSEILESSQKPWGADLNDFFPLIEAIDQLEENAHKRLLYSFSFDFSKSFYDKLQTLYSLLFHLRSLAAVDYNAHVVDPTFEGLKIDSISDYLPKPEYVVNDALLYWNFKKLSSPWVNGKNHDVRIDKLFVQPFEKSFQQYSHNACQLINNLPASQLNSLNAQDLEEKLYQCQMDWLLGTEAGLLFKIREELFGLREGYAEIFWTEAAEMSTKKSIHLQVFCELKEEDIFNTHKAA